MNGSKWRENEIVLLSRGGAGGVWKGSFG